MTANSEYDAIIVGAGPAGASTALSLFASAPDARILIIDKASFSRFKLCAGGLTRQAQAHLRWLGVGLPPEHFWIHNLEIRLPRRTHVLPQRRWAAVTTRLALDNHMLAHVRRTGAAEVREETELFSWRQDRRGVTLETSAGEIRARVVVGADGAQGIVRRTLNLADPRSEMRAIETTLFSATNPYRQRPNTAVFDFTDVPDGLNGYTWQFHSSTGSDAKVVIGAGHSIFDKEAMAPPLRPLLERTIQELCPESSPKVLGHQVRWYDGSLRHSAPRFVLVGDAAGTDPLWGEGITSALEFGMLAGREVSTALTTENFSFASYDETLRTSYLGHVLRFKVAAARYFYRRNCSLSPLVATWAAQQVYRRIRRPYLDRAR